MGALRRYGSAMSRLTVLDDDVLLAFVHPTRHPATVDPGSQPRSPVHRWQRGSRCRPRAGLVRRAVSRPSTHHVRGPPHPGRLEAAGDCGSCPAAAVARPQITQRCSPSIAVIRPPRTLPDRRPSSSALGPPGMLVAATQSECVVPVVRGHPEVIPGSTCSEAAASLDRPHTQVGLNMCTNKSPSLATSSALCRISGV